VNVFSEDERRALYAPDFAGTVEPSDADEVMLGPWREASGAALLDQLLEIDATTYLPGDLLPKIDIATMAFSLEARSPLLDHELMELAASIPPVHKARGMQRKIALRGALRGWVPDAILDGPKQGFELPVGSWLRHDLAPFAREVLLDPSSADRGWMQAAPVEALIDDHVAGRADHGRKLWSLLALELWAAQIEEPVGAGVVLPCGNPA
jgi:asparagine synthase (glutamine-hydrolysing)